MSLQKLFTSITLLFCASVLPQSPAQAQPTVSDATAAEMQRAFNMSKQCSAQNVDACLRAAKLFLSNAAETSEAYRAAGRADEHWQAMDSAVNLAEQGCLYGDDEACSYAADILLKGHKGYLSPDFINNSVRIRAANSYGLACKRKRADYCYDFANLYKQSINADSYHNLTDEDIARLYIETMQMACSYGKGQACLDLGSEFITGKFLAQNLPRSFEILTYGCEKTDNADSCTSVGGSLLLGRGIAVDKPAAVPYFLKGCNLGSGVGCNLYAYVISKGPDGVRDPQIDPAPFYERGCRLGDKDSCTRMGNGGYELGGADRVNALKSYEWACTLDYQPGGTALSHYSKDYSNATACYRLGRAILDGTDGYAKDERRGMFYAAHGCSKVDPAYCDSMITRWLAWDKKTNGRITEESQYAIAEIRRAACMNANRADHCLAFIVNFDSGLSGPDLQEAYKKMMSLDPSLDKQKGVSAMKKKYPYRFNQWACRQKR
jgi:hypothetical protein